MRLFFTIFLIGIVYNHFIGQRILRNSEDSIIKMWTHPVVNLECTEWPRSNEIQQVFDAVRLGKIDSVKADIYLNFLQENPHKSAGTAIFIEYKGYHFLLSARHVFACGGSDTMNICQGIVLVEDSTTVKNNDDGNITVDTPILGKVQNIGGSNISIEAAPGNVLLNFRYEDTLSEVRSLTFLQNTPEVVTFFFSSVNDDIGIINLDNINKQGKRFLATLYKRGYKPISIVDIDTLCNFKPLSRVLCIGYPQETQYGFHSISWYRGLFEANFRSFPMITKGFVEDNQRIKNYFEADIFTYHGFSGGPIIADNKLIGIIHGFDPENKNIISNSLSYSVVYHPKFMKSTLIYRYLKEFSNSK